MKIEISGFPGSVDIDTSEYKGDMDQFIQKILLKKMPTITNDFYNKTLRGKFRLRTRNGIELNTGIGHRYKLSEEEIVNTMENHDRFTLSYANLPTTAPKSEAAFIAGRLEKSESKTSKSKGERERERGRKTSKSKGRKTSKSKGISSKSPFKQSWETGDDFPKRRGGYKRKKTKRRKRMKKR